MSSTRHLSRLAVPAKQVLTAALLALTVLFTGPAQAADAAKINREVQNALEEFYAINAAGRTLVQKAAGALVMPNVVKAGIGIGGEYGEGALLVNGQTVDYYNVVSASIGFQLGAQVKSELVLFMNQEVLNKFRNSEGWEAGVDGSVALITLGAGQQIDTDTIQAPIVGFIFSNKGLMYNLSLEGSKFTKIKR